MRCFASRGTAGNIYADDRVRHLKGSHAREPFVEERLTRYPRDATTLIYGVKWYPLMMPRRRLESVQIPSVGGAKYPRSFAKYLAFSFLNRGIVVEQRGL